METLNETKSFFVTIVVLINKLKRNDILVLNIAVLL